MTTAARTGQAGPPSGGGGHPPVDDLLADPVVRAVLGEARQAYVAVKSQSGPHVTPLLFASSGQQCLFLSAATTLTARILRERPEIGITVFVGARAVVMSGTATVLDALRPAHLLANMRGMFPAAGLLSAFILRNAADLAGFARDLSCGRLGFHLPPRRVLILARPDRLAILDGAAVTAAAGNWRGTISTPVASSVAPGGDAVVGCDTPDGPLAFPGRWDRNGARVQLPNQLVELAGVPRRAPACVVLDDYGAPGPAPKRGVIQRGTGTLTTADGRTWFSMKPVRITTWRGVETDTVSTAEAARRAAPTVPGNPGAA